MTITMDTRSTARLREEQIKALQETTQKLDTLNKYLTDYVVLGERLKTLPDKVRHDVMVPFGKLAFMPGYLVHTNEILVLLGDNWFCERSAKQASEIAQRRVESLQKQMNDLEKQKCLLEPRLSFTTELQDILEEKSDLIEIQEEYDPETEKAWREQHRRNVKTHKSKIRAEMEKANQNHEYAHEKGTGSSMEQSFEALWQRLEELEVQEKRNREIFVLDGMDHTPEGSETFSKIVIPSPTESETKKQVKWKDLHNTTASRDHEPPDTDPELSDTDSEPSDAYSEEMVSETNDSPAEPSKIITFTHTSTPPAENEAEEQTHQEDEEVPLLTSPADVYTCFGKIPKSILKAPSEKFKLNPEEIQKMKQTRHVVEMCSEPGEPEPFTGTVLEKLPPVSTIEDEQEDVDIIQAAARCEGLTAEVSTKPLLAKTEDVPQGQKPTRKVSRFKAQRMKKPV